MEKQPENQKETQTMKDTRRVTAPNIATRFKKVVKPMEVGALVEFTVRMASGKVKTYAGEVTKQLSLNLWEVVGYGFSAHVSAGGGVSVKISAKEWSHGNKIQLTDR